RFKPKTLIYADATERPGVGASDGHFWQGAPDQGCLGTKLRATALSGRNRHTLKVTWISYLVISQSASQQQMERQFGSVVAVTRSPLKAFVHFVVGRSEKRIQHGVSGK